MKNKQKLETLLEEIKTVCTYPNFGVKPNIFSQLREWKTIDEGLDEKTIQINIDFGFSVNNNGFFRRYAAFPENTANEIIDITYRNWYIEFLETMILRFQKDER